MAHSNHYFQLDTDSGRGISIIARHDPDKDNFLQVVVKGPIYGTADMGEVGIYLTEEEQDKLIAGILERRGLYIGPDAPFWYLNQEYNGKNVEPITSDTQEKSKICPSK